jgi:hypothetical protein
MSEGGSCKPAHLGVLSRSDRVTHYKCAPLTSLPASTDLLGFRTRAWGPIEKGSVVTDSDVKLNSVKVEVR